MYDVLKPYKVEYKGAVWWYSRKALGTHFFSGVVRKDGFRGG